MSSNPAQVFAKRMSILLPNQVLDVSNLNVLKGTGTRARTLPTRGKYAPIAKVYAGTNLRIYSTSKVALEEAETLLSTELRDKWARDFERVYLYFESLEETLSSEATHVVEETPESLPVLEEEIVPTVEDISSTEIPSVTEEIDIFDFNRYLDDYYFFASYFEGVELFLRLAGWINYKYVYLQGCDEDIAQLMDQVAQADNPRKILERSTNIFVAYDMLYAWYRFFNPEKATDENVTNVLNRYAHHEGELFYRLYRKYVDSEAERVPLWFE